MNEKTLSRLAQLVMDDPLSNSEKAFKIRSNVHETYFGKSAPHPEVLPTEQQAKEMIEIVIAACKFIQSRYAGECDLTDDVISAGDQIYWAGGLKIAQSTVEAIRNA